MVWVGWIEQGINIYKTTVWVMHIVGKMRDRTDWDGLDALREDE